MGYRLTVHIDKAPSIKNAKTEAITGIKNTISVRNIPSRAQVELELIRLKEKYKISKGKNNKKMHKYGKELVYVSHEK
tara:strand:+ start:1482 stop:1715 length:234 start_codon:yes stop_codon:yes gene_type:complete